MLMYIISVAEYMGRAGEAAHVLIFFIINTGLRGQKPFMVKYERL